MSTTDSPANPAVSSKQAPETEKPWPSLRWSFADAARDNAAGDFRPSKAAETRYERQLTNVAGQVGRIMRSGGTPEAIESKLREYADLVEPWARQSAANMLAGVDRKNVKAWRGMAGKMGLDMRRLMDGPGIGQAVRERIEENVRLIRSIPFGEAEKVAAMVRENLSAGSRAEDLARRIHEESGASLARARTIAQTEVSKAQTALTRARAASVGSTGYIWRTARDGDTRDSHRHMEGVFVPWDEPPTLDGMKGHAGEFPNCRCYPEPVVPREDGDGGAAGVYKPPLPTRARERNAGEKRFLSVWERQDTSAVIPHAPGSPLVGVDGATADKQGKLVGYSLNPEHHGGRHKAKVWKATLGATQEHADMIHDQVMAFLPFAEALPDNIDPRGERFNVYVPVTGPNGKTVDVLTSWIYKRTDDKKSISMKPRLTTIFIPRGSHAY